MTAVPPGKRCDILGFQRGVQYDTNGDAVGSVRAERTLAEASRIVNRSVLR